MTDSLVALTTGLADRYRIERELGRGGMATVYLARDLKHDRDVALKVLSPDLASSMGTERFLREIRTAAALSHPHVLPLYDSGETSGMLYYVMPYVKGESLRDRLRREGQLPVDEAIRIARDVAAALTYAHSHDLIHRDIKPENILLSGGEAVLSDFGIARAVSLAGDERLTQTGLSIGTPAYMSPEQAHGDGRLDARADVYALGCVLYEMLAGDPPFTGSNVQSILARKSVETPPNVRVARDSVSPALEAVILKALARTPGDRWASAAEFADALRRQVSDAPQISSGAHESRMPRSAQRLRIGLAVAALAVLVPAFLVFSPRFRKQASNLDDAAAAEHSVAVLHFDNLSPDTADAYLAAGLTEEIISRLGKVGRLQVKKASRDAVRRVRDSVPDYLPSVGRALAVRYLVEGNVRSAGGRIRVVVSLVKSADGFRVWGEEYDRASPDLLALQADIASKVATGVAGEMNASERASLGAQPTRNAQAYEHFLKGDYNITLRAEGAARVRKALTEYQEALRLDPAFNRARSRVAYAYGMCSNYAYDCFGLGKDSLLARGFVAADSALRQDSTTSDAWLALTILSLERDPRTLVGVRGAIENAVRWDPQNAEAHHVYGFVLAGLHGELSSGDSAYRRAVEIEPDRLITLQHLAVNAYSRRLYPEALVWIDSALAISPQPSAGLYGIRSRIERHLGDTATARADAEKALLMDSTSQAYVELILLDVQAGDTARARVRFEKCCRSALGSQTPLEGNQIPGKDLAVVLAALGDVDRALMALERTPVTALFWFGLKDPNLDPLRDNARFKRFVERTRPRF
jgi:serine/threonine-protein kinase